MQNIQTIRSYHKTKRSQSAIKKYWQIYLIMLPGLLFYLIFHYLPMFGLVIAFKDVSPFDSIPQMLQAPFVGFKHFRNFMNSYYFWNVMSNTIQISLLKLLFSFPSSIILALLLNEIQNVYFKRVVQTISYLPHFVSWVVVAGLATTILSTNGGLVNEVIKLCGGKPIFFLGEPKYFRSVLVITSVWKELGWGSIIYLAAITSIDPAQIEAAVIDGASKLQRTWHIIIPGISSIIIIMLIFAVGNLLNAGFEQVMLFYSPPVYQTGDIIDTFVYREGLGNMKYSFSTAVGMFKSIIAFILILITNSLAKHFDQQGIW